jgi:hypothetical protein
MRATGRILSNISNGPHNLDSSLVQLHNFNVILFGFTFKSEEFPTLKSSLCHVLIGISLLCILHLFQIHLNFDHLVFHILERFWTKYHYVYLGHISLEYFIFYHTKLQMGSYSMKVDTHYCRRTQPNASNLPT